MRFRIPILGLCLSLCAASLPAQITQNGNLPNDFCEKAIRLEIGDNQMHRSNEWATLSPPAERPAVTPQTCIITIENDLWYRFETEAEFPYYEVIITHNLCSTPAGLQALLIRADDCNAAKFEYAACSNLESEDTIKMFLRQPQAGLQYYIWIDGFDGTVCDFNLHLRGLRQSPDPAERFRYTRYDYDLEKEPSFTPQDLQAAFVNNATTLRWKSNSAEDAAMWIIERYQNNANYAVVVGIVKPQNAVAGGESTYEFTDWSTRYRNEEYCYRMVRVASDDTRYYSDDICVTAQVVESFFVEDVKHGAAEGSYEVKYVNMAKKQDFTCDILDADMKVLKSLKLLKEPVRDGTITINMKDYAPGTYYFRMSTAKEQFLKQFTVTGR